MQYCVESKMNSWTLKVQVVSSGTNANWQKKTPETRSPKTLKINSRDWFLPDKRWEGKKELLVSYAPLVANLGEITLCVCF